MKYRRNQEFAALALTIVAFVAMVATVFIVGVWASGKAETVRIHHVSDTTDCIIVSRGANVSIDCFVVEGEHDHE